MIEKLKEKLGDLIKDVKAHNERRIYLTIEKSDIRKATEVIFNDMDARYIIVTGVDNFDSFELLYHFSFDKEGGIIVSLRTFLERENPEIESLASLIPGIAWIEREIWELLGINFKEHPNLKHLLLRHDWPEGYYPLRKEAKEDGKK